ncbi:MAG: hypothetical protein DRO98_00225 [Archaeoglobales archaeon]|nr:MAG: hypothetical protein DRO98_00225 [Archaeoglobales archaeon]
MIYLLTSLVTLFTGLIGYSLVSISDFGYRECDLKVLMIFYGIITIGFISHAFGYAIQTSIGFTHLFTAFLTVLAALYLFSNSRGRMEFSARRLRDATIYGAVIWLVGREIDYNYHNVLGVYEPTPCIIAGAVSFSIAFIMFYVLLNVKKLKAAFFPEGSEEILSYSYILVYLIGLSLLGAYIQSSVHCLSLVIATSVALYVFAKFYVTSRPFLE